MNKQKSELLLADIEKALTEGVGGPERMSSDALPLPDVYYDGKNYYIPAKTDGWVPVDRHSLSQYLIGLGFDPEKADDQRQSQVNALIVRIQTEHNVDYCGPVAGYSAGYYLMNGQRVLVTSSPHFIPMQPGDFPIVRQVIENLIGPDQLPYFYGWLKTALEMYRSHIWRPGQVLALCGPINAGKNLLRSLITQLFGGRVATPHSFMTNRTIFNRDMIGAESLAIEDQQESIDIRARRNFGNAIKNITVNKDQRCEGKGRDALTLSPLWRLIVSMNDEPERVQVLPPLDGDVYDKIMLFKVSKCEMPMPTNSPAEWAQFEQVLLGELPMFLHFLDGWEIPSALRCSRYGVKHYHNPDIADMLTEISPEGHLQELIYEVIFNCEGNIEFWEGSASALEAQLTKETSRYSVKARKLLSYSNSCGTYLGRLERWDPQMVSHRIAYGKRTVWKIRNLIWMLDQEAKSRRRATAASRRR
jgi:hypothetical protein